MSSSHRRRLLLGIPLVCGALVTLAATAQGKETTNASLRLKWLASAQFVGYYVAKDKGWYEAEGISLTINPGGPNINAESMVASGADTFGSAGGAMTLLQARSKQLPIVGIGMMFQETPYRFLALPKSGISKVTDFKGKRISTWFTGTQYLLASLLKKEGVSESDVNIEAQAASVVPFTEGKVDVATATTYDELPVLRRMGHGDVVQINPAELGLNLPNEVLITAEKTAREKPELVQGFLNASLRGWVYSFAHPKEAIDILMKSNPNIGREHQNDEMEELPKLILYGDGKTKGIGYLSTDALELTNKVLVDNGVLKEKVNVPQAVDLTFWNRVPNEDKRVSGAAN